tara:strand:- start:54 stop:344 length:291 start_codon:yes stop_codon:yes gene_type:complete
MDCFIENLPELLNSLILLATAITALILFKRRMKYNIIRTKLENSMKYLEMLDYIRKTKYNEGRNNDKNFPNKTKFEPSHIETELSSIEEFIDNLPS